MTDFARMIEDRGRNATRLVLEAKERIADPHLDPKAADELRAVIVDQVAVVYRFAASLVRNIEGQMAETANMNQLWLEAIAGELGIDTPAPPAPVLARNGDSRGSHS